ncbi:Zinc finger CCCH domain-containing protein 17 [Morus notabilis]|uniref:Zinc finger CCCH domain-containing protein 17 n=2 Tax=Morus notabilis TaxID=981085 RepID=W9SL19_9ROSA|nr:Zinc finger CCCH domain-containing protein 17 [Morus notabilis]
MKRIREEEQHSEKWQRGPLIGKGGVGSVYMAIFQNPITSWRRGLPLVVAVKSTPISSSRELAREKMVYHHLGKSPFIIRCFGDDVTVAKNGKLFYNLLLEYAPEGALFDLIITTSNGLPESQARQLSRSILGGIKHIHEAGFVHCDLKPENILVAKAINDGQLLTAKISDFGLAKRAKQSKCSVGGTLMYMSPESVRDGIQQQPSDIWALGCIVLVMLTGRLPWDERLRRQEIKRKIATESPIIPSRISKEAEDFLRKCFVRKPSERPTAQMLLNHPFVRGTKKVRDCRPRNKVAKTDKKKNEMLRNVSITTTLQGHTKAVTCIALPSTATGDKLYSGSKDGTFRVWNCHTGLCERVINLGDEISSLIHSGPWIFIGCQNLVKAWNSQIDIGFDLSGPLGRVCTMDFDNEQLFAGTESGQILVWKFNSESETANPFQPAITLEGNTHGVVCITIGCKMLYSGFRDGTIKTWDLATLQCLTTVKRHSSAVTSLACWNNYLLSCSLDGTIKTWGYTQEAGGLEVCYTHKQEQGFLALGGMNIPVMPNQGKRHDILFCSCDDHSVHIYELPSFEKKGQVFIRQEVQSIHIQDGSGGLFFIGDATGNITVGKITHHV